MRSFFMDRQNDFFSVFKGVGITIICNLIGVLVFGVVVQIASLDSSIVKAVNQFIKVLSLFMGCISSLKGKLGFLKGLIVGIVSNFIIHIIFSIISQTKLFTNSFLADMIFLAIIGLISGIISVNAKKSSTN